MRVRAQKEAWQGRGDGAEAALELLVEIYCMGLMKTWDVCK